MKAHEKIQALREDGYVVRVMHSRPVESEDGRIDGMWATKRDLRQYHELAALEDFKQGTENHDPGAKFADTRGETTVGIGYRVSDSTGEESYDHILALGTAGCYHRDRWNRKMGLTVALGRAVKNLEEFQRADVEALRSAMDPDAVQADAEAARAEEGR